MSRRTVCATLVVVIATTMLLAAPAPSAVAAPTAYIDMCGSNKGWSGWQTSDLSVGPPTRTVYFVPYAIGTHYIEFRGVYDLVYPMIKMTPHWSTSGDLIKGPWKAWGPYASFDGRTTRVTLKTGAMKVRYKFIFEKASRSVANKFQFRIYCGR